MALPGYQFTVTDEEGNIVPGAAVRVTLESDGSLPVLYTDPLGASPAGNPIYSDSDGFVYFHVASGVYKVKVTWVGEERTYRYVNLGTAVTDGVTPGIKLNYSSANTSATDPGAGAFKVNNTTFASITALYLDNADVDANTISALLDTWDDNNNSSHRGTLELRSTTTPNIFGVFIVTGSIVDSTGFRTVSVTPVAGSAVASWDGEFAFAFSRTGNTGSMATTGTPVANNLVKYLDTSGVNVGDAGVATSTDGTFAGNSDALLPTQKAVKTYVDALADLINLMQYKGVLDCSANPNYPAASAGHAYLVSVAGKVGGGSGRNVEVGDLLLCKTDSTASGNEATVGAQWGTVQTNLLDTGNLAYLNAAQQWTRPQRSSATALTASTGWDAGTSSRLTAAVSTAFQIANPTGGTAIDGQFYHFEITYSGTGPVTFGSQYKGLSAITWTNTSGKKDRATFQYNSANTEFEYVGHSLDVRA